MYINKLQHTRLLSKDIEKLLLTSLQEAFKWTEVNNISIKSSSVNFDWLTKDQEEILSPIYESIHTKPLFYKKYICIFENKKWSKLSICVILPNSFQGNFVIEDKFVLFIQCEFAKTDSRINSTLIMHPQIFFQLHHRLLNKFITQWYTIGWTLHFNTTQHFYIENISILSATNKHTFEWRLLIEDFASYQIKRYQDKEYDYFTHLSYFLEKISLLVEKWGKYRLYLFQDNNIKQSLQFKSIDLFDISELKRIEQWNWDFWDYYHYYLIKDSKWEIKLIYKSLILSVPKQLNSINFKQSRYIWIEDLKISNCKYILANKNKEYFLNISTQTLIPLSEIYSKNKVSLEKLLEDSYIKLMFNQCEHIKWTNFYKLPIFVETLTNIKKIFNQEEYLTWLKEIWIVSDVIKLIGFDNPQARFPLNVFYKFFEIENNQIKMLDGIFYKKNDQILRIKQDKDQITNIDYTIKDYIKKGFIFKPLRDHNSQPLSLNNFIEFEDNKVDKLNIFGIHYLLNDEYICDIWIIKWDKINRLNIKTPLKEDETYIFFRRRNYKKNGCYFFWNSPFWCWINPRSLQPQFFTLSNKGFFSLCDTKFLDILFFNEPIENDETLKNVFDWKLNIDEKNRFHNPDEAKRRQIVWMKRFFKNQMPIGLCSNLYMWKVYQPTLSKYCIAESKGTIPLYNLVVTIRSNILANVHNKNLFYYPNYNPQSHKS